MMITATFKPTHVVVNGLIVYKNEEGEILSTEAQTFEYMKDKFGNLVEVKTNNILKLKFGGCYEPIIRSH